MNYSILVAQVYYGTPADLPSYCEGLGKSPPPYVNIGEFFLEVVDQYESNDNVKVRWRLASTFLVAPASLLCTLIKEI